MFTEHLLLPAEKADLPYVIHHRWGRPTDNYFYHDENCRLLGIICRYDTPDGKQFLPYTLWATERAPNGEWLRRSWPTLRPLYRLDNLAAYPDAIVVICEGEKAANAAQQLLPLLEYVCITSPGGSNAAHRADWSPIKGRTVIIWPDNDEPGQHYAQAVIEKLDPSNAISLMPIPSDKPLGWDAADALAEGWL